jgi:hypothetical protein
MAASIRVALVLNSLDYAVDKLDADRLEDGQRKLRGVSGALGALRDDLALASARTRPPPPAPS